MGIPSGLTESTENPSISVESHYGSFQKAGAPDVDPKQQDHSHKGPPQNRAPQFVEAPVLYAQRLECSSLLGGKL